MGKREEALRDQEFEQPWDECPIDTPSGWEYRGLMNTGGGVFCRIWRHKTEQMELLYNMLDSRVSIIGAKYSDESERYEGDLEDVIDRRDAGDGYTESDLMQLAKELMTEHQ